MKLLLAIISLFLTEASAQQTHKDQYQYGYKGKVKQVVKKTYPCGGDGCEQLDFEHEPLLTHTYYYNQNGNIDSTVAMRFIEAQKFILTTRYQFTNSRKSGWETLTQDNELYARAVTNWITDREYAEKVYGTNNELQVELRYWLDDNFRLLKLRTKLFDRSLGVLEESVQKFEFDETGKIKNYTTTHGDGTTVVAQYQYLESDDLGNPLKIVIDKGGKERKSVIVLTFSYYD